MVNPGRPSLSVYAAVFLLCVSSLSAEVTVTRLLAYRFFFHFVFLVLSVAQLGLAAAAAWVFVRRRPSGMDFAYRAMIGFGVSLFAFLVIYAVVLPDRKLLTDATPYVLICAVSLLPPYFAVGAALSAMFTCYKPAFNRLYAVDLAGAAAGCVLCVGMMMLAGPVKSVALTAVIALLAAATLGWGMGRNAWVCVAGALVAGLLGCFGGRFLGEGTKTAGLDFQWNHLARTDRIGPSHYVIDGDAATFYADWCHDDVEYEVTSPHPSVAIIGPGAGPQLSLALDHGAQSVFAVDINPTIIEWDKGIDASVNGGIFNRPDVEVVVNEGRHTLSVRDDRFDLIVMHAIDTYTASAACAYSLSENHLYTVEAFQSYYQHLAEHGVMSTRRWLFFPARETLRLFTTALAALEAEGVDHPERHFVILSPVRNYERLDLKAMGYLLLFKEAVTAQQIEAVERYVAKKDWAFLYRPDRPLDTPFSDYVRAPDRGQFLADYPFNVTPCRDANPFFFQLVKPAAYLFPTPGQMTSTVYSQSTASLFSTLLALLVLTAAMLWLPMKYYRKTHALPPPRRWIGVYFACLGLGFMAAEMGTIQVFSLFLGHPTYALSVILLGLLAFAGLGSMLSSKVGLRAAPVVCLAVSLLALGSAQVLLPLAHRLIGLSFSGRVAVALVYLALIGTPLGMPMSLGIRGISPSRTFDVAWAWACNGAAGVIGTNICMILMVFVGTNASFLVAVAAYLVAWATLSFDPSLEHDASPKEDRSGRPSRHEHALSPGPEAGGDLGMDL